MSEVLEKQEKSEMERVKHFLLIDGLRKKRKLERPVHVLRLASSFIEDTLKLKVFIQMFNLFYYDIDLRILILRKVPELKMNLESVLFQSVSNSPI